MADTTPSKTNTEASIVTAAPQGSISTPATDVLSLLTQFNKLKQLFFQHMHKGTDKSKVLPVSGATVYAGRVNSDGTAGSLPSKPAVWTSARSSGQPTGDYTVTHNLGNANYGLAITVDGASLADWEIFSRLSNSFRVQTYSTGASIQDHSFEFILVPIV